MNHGGAILHAASFVFTRPDVTGGNGTTGKGSGSEMDTALSMLPFLGKTTLCLSFPSLARRLRESGSKALTDVRDDLLAS